jgi:hypothetical protein
VALALEEAATLWPERRVGCLVSLGCGIMPKEDSKFRAKRFKNALFDNLTDTEPRHEEMLRKLDIPHNRGDSNFRFGGPAGAGEEARLQGAFYLRLNPRLDAKVEMDTKDPRDLQALREAAERVCHEGADRLGQAAERLRQLTAQQAPGASPPLRILCIDGGGIKGLVPAIVLQELQRLCGGRPLHELFDLACGTSTGGIIALGTCAAGQPIETMIDVYEQQAAEIWDRKAAFGHGGATKKLGVAARHTRALARTRAGCVFPQH